MKLRFSQILTIFISEDSFYCKWEKSSSNYLKQRFWLSHILGKLWASLNPGIQSRGFPSMWDLFSGSCFHAVTQRIAGGSKLILIARDPSEYMYRIIPEKALGMSINWLNLDSMPIHGQTIEARVIGFSEWPILCLLPPGSWKMSPVSWATWIVIRDGGFSKMCWGERKHTSTTNLEMEIANTHRPRIST